ncbi:uracil-DNA glycosylase [Jannaschia sp. W003]|uniref:uracil-DNA glycosylase n=1 Tax=Jannaschia sp. W003 TaxID=2867012 RepID=UPI0021A787F1|nr:uracil-DNA glycosylase [Jannaschia sp. W003]UWQ21251.1 uracil-DNA glycosylase [Jannaschia sp. W003]
MPSPPNLADPAEAERRRTLLGLSHAAPLARHAEKLRREGLPGDAVPDFDPLDGGTGARLLLLMEKPGPGAARTGFVSQDNPDPTAAAVRRFLGEAGIARADVAIWNTVPFWNGTIRFTAAERARGLAALPATLALLPRLRVTVMVGRQAERARGMLEGRGLHLATSAHPSGQVRAARPALWAAIPAIWAEAARSLR